MTSEQIVAGILAFVAASIASALTYVALRMPHGVRVKGVVVEWSYVGGEDGGYSRKVRYEAGLLGERICRPLGLVHSAPGESGTEVDLIYHPSNPKLVMFADFPARKAAALAWAATIFILWTVWRAGG